MLINRMSFILCATVLFLTGCQKASDPPTPVTSSAPGTTAPGPASGAPSVSPSGSASTSPNASVAAPAAAVPPSDAAIKPTTPGSAPSSGNAQSPTQANPSALTKEQEQAAMPHSGQVNNHSVPNTTGEKK